MLSTLICGVSASDSSTSESGVRENIITALNKTEPFKDVLGLGNVDYMDLEIGAKINLYEYVNDEFSLIRAMYPLFEDGALVAFAIELDNNVYQIATQLVSELSAASNDTDTIALLYDAEACYLFDGASFTFLVYSGIKDDTRDYYPRMRRHTIPAKSC